MENSNLYVQKKSILDSTKELDSSFEHFTFIDFQGIQISFYAKDQSFTNFLLSLLPKHWCSTNPTISSDCISIYHFNISNFDISQDQFSNESSQDCYFDDNKVIHRDFCSIAIDKRTHILVCPQNDSDSIYNFLRMLLPKLLFTKNKYIIHSSCVLLKNNTAALFLGHSGHGKTTIASLAQGRKILSDDMNIIDMNNLKVNAACLGHAYHTNGSYDMSYKISNFYWIHKSDENFVKEITPAKAALLLLASVTNLFWDQLSEQEIHKVMEDVNIICDKIPFKELFFTKNSQIWNVID